MLLVGSGVGGSNGCDIGRVVAVIAARRLHPSDASCPALGTHAASVSHGVDEAEVEAERKNNGVPVTAPSTSSPPEGTTGEAGPLRPRRERKPSARYDPATWELAPLQKGATTK